MHDEYEELNWSDSRVRTSLGNCEYTAQYILQIPFGSKCVGGEG